MAGLSDEQSADILGHDRTAVMTAEQWFEGMRHAQPPTPDDVTTLWDGRRLDSREAMMEWLAEVAAKRAEEAAAGADAGT